MSRLIFTIGAVILGICLVQLANGFLGTLVSMETSAAGFSPAVMGIVLASYFGGYTIGAVSVGRLLMRVGHIRMFAALAGLVAASVIVQPILTSAPAWIFIRLATGFGCAGLFITAESWLNASSTAKNRGAVFALYMVATNACFGGGQFLLNLPAPMGFELFALAAALFCLALIPVSLTHASPPVLPPAPSFGLRELRRLAPVSIAGCAASGLASSAFYALVPAYGQAQGVEASWISAYIATAIFGGLAFQVPVGKLSDRFDRRVVVACVAAGLSVMALVLALLPQTMAILVATFVLGGFLSTIYPVAVAHANDRVDPQHAVSVSGLLILVNGIASFVSPMIGTGIMGRAGFTGVFVYMAIVAGLFAFFALWRARTVEQPEHKERPFVFLSERMGHQSAHVADDADTVDMQEASFANDAGVAAPERETSS
jgi:MFS family permease